MVDRTDAGLLVSSRCLGYPKQLHLFVNPDLSHYDGVRDFVLAAAGTWNDVFPITPADIVRVAGGVVTELKRA